MPRDRFALSDNGGSQEIGTGSRHRRELKHVVVFKCDQMMAVFVIETTSSGVSPATPTTGVYERYVGRAQVKTVRSKTAKSAPLRAKLVWVRQTGRAGKQWEVTNKLAGSDGVKDSMGHWGFARFSAIRATDAERPKYPA